MSSISALATETNFEGKAAPSPSHLNKHLLPAAYGCTPIA